MNPSDEWATPVELFNALNKTFGPFDVDGCANNHNAKLPSYYGLDRGIDALQIDWNGIVWLNCPYSTPYPWLKKASEQAMKGCKVVCLLKADHTTAWYKDFIYDYSKVQFHPGVERIDLPKRVKFIPPPGLINKNTGLPVKAGSPNYPSMVVVFHPFGKIP